MLSGGTLRRHYSNTLLAVIVMAMGVGSISSVFSVLNAVVLYPLPYNSPDDLLVALESNEKLNRLDDWVREANFLDWRSDTRTVDLASYQYVSSERIELGREPEEIVVASVSWDFFRVLQVSMHLGRSFVEDDEALGGDNVGLLDYEFWHSQYGGDKRVLGDGINVGGRLYTVVGVLPKGFRFPLVGQATQPVVAIPRSFRSPPSRRGNQAKVLGRLIRGVALTEAVSELDTIARRLSRDHRRTNDGWTVQVLPLRDRVLGDARPHLLALVIVGCLILAISIANVGSILLALGGSRTREFATRAALGGTRLRLFGQVIGESLAVSVAGCGLGLVAGVSASRFIATAVLPYDALVQYYSNPTLDGTVVLFAVVVSLGAGVVAGLLPALRCSRRAPAIMLKGVASSIRFGPRRVPSHAVLLAAQVAFTTVLVANAALLAATLIVLRHPNTAYDVAKTLTVRATLGADHLEKQRRRDFFQQAMARLTAIPGVTAAAAISSIDYEVTTRMEVEPDSIDLDPAISPSLAAFYSVTADYFDTVGASLLKGRYFTDSDTPAALPPVVINQSVAKLFWPKQNPLGQTLLLRVPHTTGSKYRVVGVVRDLPDHSSSGQEVPKIYEAISASASPPLRSFLILRTDPEPHAIAPSIMKTLSTIDPGIKADRIRTLDQLYDSSVLDLRKFAYLAALLACVALLVAVAGVYGQSSYLASSRSRELGIRFALGASQNRISTLVLSDALLLLVPALVVGVGGAVWLARVLAPDVSGLKDPFLPSLGTAAGLALVAVLASYVAVRRTLSRNPADAIRAS